MTPGDQKRFRVELLVNTINERTDMIFVKEVMAAGEEAAAEVAIRMLKGENPRTSWLKIDPWYVERLRN